MKDSNKIYSCYKYNNLLGFPSNDKKLYRQDYYHANRNTIMSYAKNYNMIHKERLKRLKAIWFQKNKERLRIKWGYKRRNKTKNKTIIPPTTYTIKPIVIDLS